ncbi:NAD(P)-binding protein [Staphylococcus canis]|uniref:precorrin-2 dehydrogenase n=1 Tax=Staphylococcus canis TaxID=2724942 RepID=A0ABS0T8P4_9STAP|nr:NAD(P)-binding protein [Staphylococcus canis]MBI5974128.1 NAD(P)-binding protein [Staphylococcus canis]
MILPLMVNMPNIEVLVVGGGEVATRRIKKLLNSSSTLIHVVSPSITSKLETLVKTYDLKWSKRPFEDQDIEGVQLVIAATNDAQLHKHIQSLIPKHMLFNDVIHHENSNVYFAQTVHRGKLSIHISTSGASPKLTRKIAKDIGNIYDERYENYIDFLYESRKLILKKAITPEDKAHYLETLLDSKFLNVVEQDNFLKMLC